MLAYVVRRLLSAILLVLALTLVTYLVFFTIPTSPGCLVVNCGPANVGRATPEELKAAEHKLGVDRPVIVQYGHFVWNLFRHGTLGNAYRGFSVDDQLKKAVPVTASIVLGGAVLLLLLSIPLAFLSASRPRSLLDRGILLFALFGVALHPFVVGLLLRNVFAKRLQIAPSEGYCALTDAFNACDGPVQWAYHLYLPWLTFAFFFLPLYTRLIRARVLEQFGEQYVLAARAKGASELRVIRKHILRNAIPPVLSLLAADIGTAITAAIYIETIFGLDGLGHAAVLALSGESGGYDLPVIVGILFSVAAAVSLLSMLADVAVAWLDPRVRIRSGAGLVAVPRPVARVTEPIGRLVRRPLTAAALGATVGVGLTLVFALTDRPEGASQAATSVPLRTIPLHWVERKDINGIEMTFTVESIGVGRNQWLVKGSFTNRSKVRIGIMKGDPRSFQSSGMALVFPKAPDDYFSAPLKVLPAADVQPRMPQFLSPGQGWSGSLSGRGELPHDKGIWVSFGLFTPEGLDRGFNWITDHALTL